MMIHNVYFWLKEDLGVEDLAAIEAGFKALCTETTAIKGHYGKPAATTERPVTDKSFTYNLLLVFEDIKAHDVYQVSEVHQDFIAAHKDKWTAVKVFDSTVM